MVTSELGQPGSCLDSGSKAAGHQEEGVGCLLSSASEAVKGYQMFTADKLSDSSQPVDTMGTSQNPKEGSAGLWSPEDSETRHRVEEPMSSRMWEAAELA